MSMGTCAAFAEVIEPKFVKKIVGKKLAPKVTRFIDSFEKLEEKEGASSLIEFLRGDDGAVTDPQEKSLVKLLAMWVELSNAVFQETGLNLEVDFHDVDNDGDRYDEVDGLFFSFDNFDLYEPTPQFKALQDKLGKDVVERKFYTVYC